MYSRILLRLPHKEPKIRFRIYGLLTKCKFKIYYLLTESEVITGKYQTQALMDVLTER